MLIGPNAEQLRKLEAEHVVAIELPGLNRRATSWGAAPSPDVTTSLRIKGRKKHVAAPRQRHGQSALAPARRRETLELDDDDATLLASLFAPVAMRRCWRRWGSARASPSSLSRWRAWCGCAARRR